jgi:hypothetical protein
LSTPPELSYLLNEALASAAALRRASVAERPQHTQADLAQAADWITFLVGAVRSALTLADPSDDWVRERAALRSLVRRALEAQVDGKWIDEAIRTLGLSIEELGVVLDGQCPGRSDG